MYHKVCEKLSLAASASEVSQAVPMGEFNTVQVECTILTGGPTGCDLEFSNDLENWSGATDVRPGGVPISGPSYTLMLSKTVTALYVRVKWTADVNATVIAGGINLSAQ